MSIRLPLAGLAAALSAALAPAHPPRPDGPDRPLDAPAREAVVAGVLAELNKSYVFPETAAKMAAAVRATQAAGGYDAERSGRGFARRLTDDLRAVSKDGHLGVVFSPDPPPAELPTEPPPAALARMTAMAARRGFGFRKVEHLGGGVGLLEVEGFGPPELIGPAAAAAAGMLAGCDAVVVDLRRNGGGDPAGVQLLCSYFFDRPTHLNDIVDRTTGRTRQFWTHPSLPGPKLGGAAVYVLTARRTFSGAEEFAYNLQTRKRGTVVGETTGGGAHPSRPARVGDHFLVEVPYARAVNPVTGTNWEGTGVTPDVAVPEGHALLTAHALALRKGLAKHAADPGTVADLNRTLARVEVEMAKLTSPATANTK